MNRNKKIVGAIIFILSVTFIFSNINAANIGISPGDISFRNVLRGGYAEKNITISVDATKPIQVQLEPRDIVGTWLNFSEMNFTLSRDEPYQLRIMLRPPNDIPNGNYTGFVRFSTSGFGDQVEGHAVGIVRSSLDLVIYVEIIDTEIVQCGVSEVNALSVEKGDDVVFNLKFSNWGNVRLNPKFNIHLWDTDQISIIKNQDFVDKEILPTNDGIVQLRMGTSDLEIGQYWAEILEPDCYYSQIITFDVLEIGALKSEGTILGIVTKKTGQVDETIPINVLFKNTGQKEVEAQFKGKISQGDKIIQVLESEKVKVLVGETNKFNFYFTPKNSGKYVISGRVYYDGKKTFESSTSIDIDSKKFQMRNFIVFGIYLLLIFIILILFFKIRKEKLIYKNKIRRFR